MKKFFELTENEMLKVYDNNKRLQQMVLDDMIDTEDFWTDEYLKPIAHTITSYDIGYCGCYMSGIKDVNDFINGVKQMQKDFCFLPDAENEYINRLANTINTYYSKYYEGSHENFEEFFYNECEELLDKISAQFKRHYNFTAEHEKEYFLEFYIDERMNKEDNYYIDDDYVLYETEIMTTCYA